MKSISFKRLIALLDDPHIAGAVRVPYEIPRPTDTVDDIVEQVELCLERPHDPIRSLDRHGWAVAIKAEMPWHLPSEFDAAAVKLEQKYWQGWR